MKECFTTCMYSSSHILTSVVVTESSDSANEYIMKSASFPFSP